MLAAVFAAVFAAGAGLMEARTRRMSLTARAVPRTVPVTFDLPVRGWYGTAVSWIRQPASAARTTISSG